ncbi:MAG: ACP S-malonyltransferase [bacterium]
MGLGLIFPGQGSQQAGMGKDFAERYAEARRIFEEAGEALGFDLRKICVEGPEEELTLTYNAQPAILTVSTIAHRLLGERAPLAPLSLAGHSLGEYSALVAAGALGFADAVRVVHRRGKFMQEATPVGVGAMAAILGAEPTQLEALCREEAGDEVVGPANFNTPGQIVISGHAAAVERVLARAKGKRLPVSAPFHSPLMAPAAEKMRAVLAEIAFHDATAPICTNTSNAFLTDKGDFAAALVEQVTSPVRWDTGIAAMIADGVTQFVEVGHGTILSGMNRRIDKSVATRGVHDDASLGATLTEFFA